MNPPPSLDTDTVVSLLIGTSGRLEQTYRTLCEEWLPDSPPTTLVFASLGRSICRGIECDSDEKNAQLWSTVEKAMDKGDEAVKNALATGLLEAVLSAASGGLSITSITRHFGPTTMAYCRAWDEFTGCTTDGIS